MHVNLIDTPGHAEFCGAALAALDAVETVAIVVDASNGIDHATRRLMRHARSRGDCRMLVINKIDAEGVDLPRLVDQLREEFGPECLPINCHPARRAASLIVSTNPTATAISRQGREGTQRRGSARCLRAVPARRPPDSHLLRFRTQRSGRC
ncbi:MAG: GTP-binding protein [Dokdonella sp.]